MLNNLPEIRKIYNHLKKSAKKRNIEFDLTITDLYKIDYPISCPILNIPLKFHKGVVEDDSYSYDRIDSEKGYSLENLQVISMKANRAKNNLTLEEIKLLSNFYKY
jgi:hypothetical protein